MNTFFSIITVSLNAGESLLKTIDSILIQDFQDFEIIIKDGFSNDGSYENISEDEKILKLQIKDTGIYDAMNQALEYTSGEYILFLNAGDYFYDSKVLNSFYDAIVSNNSPELLYCDYTTTGLKEFVQSPIKLTSFYLNLTY